MIIFNTLVLVVTNSIFLLCNVASVRLIGWLPLNWLTVAGQWLTLIRWTYPLQRKWESTNIFVSFRTDLMMAARHRGNVAEKLFCNLKLSTLPYPSFFFSSSSANTFSSSLHLSVCITCFVMWFCLSVCLYVFLVVCPIAFQQLLVSLCPCTSACPCL